MLALALLIAIATITSGLAVRCGMAVHCDLCPSATTVITSAVDCPEMLPAGPSVSDGEVHVERSLTGPDVAVLTPTIEPSGAPDGGLPIARRLFTHRSPGSPGTVLVLRI